VEDVLAQIKSYVVYEVLGGLLFGTDLIPVPHKIMFFVEVAIP
jgi:hypothetical protein